MSAYAHMPGIDILMNYFESGHPRPVRQRPGRQGGPERRQPAGPEADAVRNLRRLGLGPDLLRPEEDRRLGVCPGRQFHQPAPVLCDDQGARKRDHPLSFSYHEPWWRAYRLLADYFGRLSVVMSVGRQVNRILVLEPTTTAWMYYSPAGPNRTASKAIGREFQDFIQQPRGGAVRIRPGQRSHPQGPRHGPNQASSSWAKGPMTLVVLPPGLENLEGATVGLLRDYLDRGGKVLSWVDAPDLRGRPAPTRSANLAASSRGWTSVPVRERPGEDRRHLPVEGRLAKDWTRPCSSTTRRELADGNSSSWRIRVRTTRPGAGYRPRRPVRRSFGTLSRARSRPIRSKRKADPRGEFRHPGGREPSSFCRAWEVRRPAARRWPGRRGPGCGRRCSPHRT